MIQAEDLIARYASLDDDRLIRLALYEGRDLSSVALQVLKSELMRRGLPSYLIEAAEIHERGLSREERSQIVEWLRGQPCPSCGKTDEALNAVRTETVTSFVVASKVETAVIVACPQCLEGSVAAAQAGNALGWWSVPGFFQTIKAEVSNESALQNAHQLPTSDALLAFVEQHIVPLCLARRHGHSPFG